MVNPIMHELVAREQHNDRLREIEQTRLVNAATTRQPARRIDLRAALGRSITAVRYRFKLHTYFK